MNKVTSFLNQFASGPFKIIEEPHPTLRLVAPPITEFGPELLELKKRMHETMIKANGIGLAAPQINLSVQIFLMDEIIYHGEENFERITHLIINPEILSSSGKDCIEEGCLSIPGKRISVDRAAQILVKYQNENGKIITREFIGLAAICFQHELDHLLGKLMIDYP